MYDPTKGKILIDGQDIKSMPLQAYRKSIGYVQQDVFLFSDSILNNVQFGLTDLVNENGKHIEATKAANVYNEINQLPSQFETTVGERGTTLSGGQKQRISIARSIIKEPSVFIFDDCLSAVDTKTEQSILKNLATYIDQKTAIFITHRIFFTYQFDVIIYLEEGKIVEIGTHESLLAKKGLYAELYSLQQTQENS
jgi:ATP-binding cassette subfamily B protein